MLFNHGPQPCGSLQRRVRHRRDKRGRGWLSYTLSAAVEKTSAHICAARWHIPPEILSDAAAVINIPSMKTQNRWLPVVSGRKKKKKNVQRLKINADIYLEFKPKTRRASNAEATCSKLPAEHVNNQQWRIRRRVNYRWEYREVSVSTEKSLGFPFISPNHTRVS